MPICPLRDCSCFELNVCVCGIWFSQHSQHQQPSSSLTSYNWYDKQMNIFQKRFCFVFTIFRSQKLIITATINRRKKRSARCLMLWASKRIKNKYIINSWKFFIRCARTNHQHSAGTLVATVRPRHSFYVHPLNSNRPFIRLADVHDCDRLSQRMWKMRAHQTRRHTKKATQNCNTVHIWIYCVSVSVKQQGCVRVCAMPHSNDFNFSRITCWMFGTSNTCFLIFLACLFRRLRMKRISFLYLFMR